MRERKEMNREKESGGERDKNRDSKANKKDIRRDNQCVSESVFCPHLNLL